MKYEQFELQLMAVQFLSMKKLPKYRGACRKLIVAVMQRTGLSSEEVQDKIFQLAMGFDVG